MKNSLEQKVRLKINLQEYFGSFVEKNQVITVEGFAFGMRENFLGTGNDFIFLALENGEVLAVNASKAEELEIIDD